MYQGSNLILKTVANYTYYKSGIFLSNLVDAFGRGPIWGTVDLNKKAFSSEKIIVKSVFGVCV